MTTALPPVNYRADVAPFGGTAPRPRWQEWVSWSVVESIASAAGLVVQVMRIDSNRKDIQVETWGALDGRKRTIGLQLKSTFAPIFVENGAFVAYDLDRESYNDLIDDGNVPRFLVIVAVPRPEAPLARARPHIVALSAAAWWGEVEGTPTEQGSRRIKLPTEQRFDAEGLRTMLLKA